MQEACPGMIKQPEPCIITHSIMKVEYIVTCEAAKEAVLLRKFLHNLEVVPNMNMPHHFIL